MANAHSHDSHDAGHGSVKSYAIGFILSVILTVIPFGLVMYPTLPKSTTRATLRLRKRPGFTGSGPMWKLKARPVRGPPASSLPLIACASRKKAE